MVERTCHICKVYFKAQINHVKKGYGKYCSRKCLKMAFKTRDPWNKGKKTGQTVWNKGIKGKQPWMNVTGLEKGRGFFKGKHNRKNMGENHWRWKGGDVRKKRHDEMGTLEYKLWRRAVFERDNYECVKCGGNKSGELEADHIKPWSVFPDLRYAIDNGETLCISCHKNKTTTDMIMYFGHEYREVN